MILSQSYYQYTGTFLYKVPKIVNDSSYTLKNISSKNLMVLPNMYMILDI
jgi:hypothetical protein